MKASDLHLFRCRFCKIQRTIKDYSDSDKLGRRICIGCEEGREKTRIRDKEYMKIAGIKSNTRRLIKMGLIDEILKEFGLKTVKI